jgi:hypothetical protein
MRIIKSIIVCSFMSFIACGEDPADSPPEASDKDSEEGMVKLTQLTVNADGTTTQNVEHVTAEEWAGILAAKKQGKAGSGEKSLTFATGSSCLTSDLWLYTNTDGWIASPPSLCVRGTGDWEANPPGCSFLCFNFKSFWPGSSGGSFNSSHNMSCSTTQYFDAWAAHANINRQPNAWVSLPQTCSPD